MSARLRPCFAWLLLCAASVFPAAAGLPFSFETTPGKLPKDIIPHHYAIRLQPDLASFTTRGSVVVDLEILRPARSIVFNALDLKITHAGLLDRPDINFRVNADPDQQIVTLRCLPLLQPGNYRLAVEYTGRLTEQAQGLFYTKYAAPSGKKILLATEMEPADARRMFPCWDEPAFRATFGLSVVLPREFKAVANMPVEAETDVPGGLKETRFADTPPMASYLVALVAGELEELDGESEGVKIHIITTEGKREQGRFALAATKELLTYYNDYFGIKYPLPKLDQIALPGGFDGAMENWGAITYNESLLLYDPRTSSADSKRVIFVDIAHEMSHQWFGNLVTMAWWDNLWLNEGFATWMETKATDHFNPAWEMWLGAGVDKSGVMESDAHASTHPIHSPVVSESEANDAFDGITYQKGGAFLRMLEDYLGPEVFRQGVQSYLATHLYSNATTEDLWDALQKVSGKPIRAISAGWTEQPGLPLVKLDADCVAGKRIVSLEQLRFTLQDPKAAPLLWHIPISLATTAHPGESTQFLLTNQSAQVTLPDCAGVVKANAGDTGYYRVSYAPALFAQLQQNINLLSVADRLNLLNDCWAMVEAGRASVTNYFALVGALQGETTFSIWDQILSTFYLLDALEQNQPGRAAFQAYARSLLQAPFAKLGWEALRGEPPNFALLRGKLIIGLGHFGDQTVIAESRKRFDDFITKPSLLRPDLRPAVLQVAGRYSDKKIHEQIHDLARHAAGSEERERYYQVLAAALDPDLARATLALSLTDETVPQEATQLVIDVAQNGEQPELAWQFLRQHFTELLPKVDSFARDDYVPAIMSSFNDPARADELESFVHKKFSADAAAKARVTAGQIRFKAWLKTNELPVVDDWVKSQSPK